jgi:hypothetical protein
MHQQGPGCCAATQPKTQWAGRDRKAIRTILADIANATRVTSDRVTETSKYETKETNRLLKLAMKKQWGSAIDLE